MGGVVSARGDAAYAAKRGWRVFPLRPGDKRPLVAEWEQRASADPAYVAEHWPKQSVGYGVACGPSGLVVVDLDVPKQGQEPPAEWALPGVTEGSDVLAVLAERAGVGLDLTTQVANTPSGGQHWYYRAPDDFPVRNSAGALGWLVDVRAQGGYVVGPGSVVGGRTYEVVVDADPQQLPAWLAELLRPAAAASRPRPGPVLAMPPDGTSRGVRYSHAVLRGELEAVLLAAQGTRNSTLNRAAHAVARKCVGMADPAAVERALVDAGVAVGLPEREAVATVRSGLRAGGGR